MVDCSQKLRQLREVKRLTQAQVASKIGVSKQMLSAYETASKAPSVEVLIRLSRLYGVTIDYLVMVDEPKTINLTGLDDEAIALIVSLVDKMKRGNNILGNE